jgi:hypothetical protein
MSLRDAPPLVVEYLGAVLRHWFLLVVAVVGGILGFIDLVVHGGPTIPVWLWVTIMMAGLVVAQFLAWTDMRTEWRGAAEARDQLADAALAPASAADPPVELNVRRDVRDDDGRTLLQLACHNEGRLQLDDLVARISKIERRTRDGWVPFNELDADHFMWDGPGTTTTLRAGSEALLLVASAERVGNGSAGTLWRSRTGRDAGPLSDKHWDFGTWRFQVAFEASHHRTQLEQLTFTLAPPPSGSKGDWNFLVWVGQG